MERCLIISSIELSVITLRNFMTSTHTPTMHLYESGDPAAPAILFLHGSPLSGRMWQPQLETLPEFHCLAPDLPGHGLSSRMGAIPTDELVDSLVRLIQLKSPTGKAHVVGLSYGGVVAQALISGAPNVVERAILSGTSGRLSNFMSKVFRVYLKINEPVLKIMSPGLLGKLLAFQFGIPSQYIEVLGEDMKRMDPAVMVKVLMQSYLDIRTPVNTSIPVLVVVGGRETPFAKSMARDLTHQIPGAKGIVIPGLGHVWNMQDPQLFAMIARSWFIEGKVPERMTSVI
jgi:pimeloyl-ACP methyl ester carboxylesterase